MIKNEIELSKEELELLLREKLKNLKDLEKIGKNSIYIRELSNIALIQLQLEQYIDSENNYLTCLKHFKRQKDRLGQAAVLGLLGTLNFKNGDFERSLDFYIKANDIYKVLKQIYEQITCLKGIGNNYIKLNQWVKASDAFLDCCAICSDNNDIYDLLDCLGNLIHIYEMNEQWDVVFELYEKSLQAFKEINDQKGIINSYFNLGILKKRSNKLNEALKYFKKGTNVAIDKNLAELILKGLGYLGETLFYLGEIKEAKNQFIKAYHLANKIKAQNAKIQIKILLQSLGLGEKDIIEELNQYKESR